MAPPPGQAYDDEELSISLNPSNNRRTQNKPPDASGHNARAHEERRAVEPTPQKAETRIGAYQVLRTLGEGSFGKVKLAVHRVTNQQVALKIIARKKLISRDMAGRVEREIEYLQLLRHPHIIKLYTVIKTQHEIVMVLEYAGGELFDYIVQHGKMQEPKARRFFQQIICAVEYCHRHKIVHRDLKPENLLLDDHLNVKIADFGLSNIMTDGNFLKTSCGSPNYAAPEVINGKLYAGPEVDVWSCGVILYVLLVGRLPFDDEHIPSLFAKIAKGHYVVPSYMSRGAASLIKKMLAVNPVHRATIDEIRQDPWFLEQLPSYLKPPAEEFINTGIDPTKAINIQEIAPGESLAVQEKLHNAITDKISKTMGYGKQDVQEALEADEASAIKDAYLIVRENKLMEANPHLGENPFTASSPPTWKDEVRRDSPRNTGSPRPANGAASSPKTQARTDGPVAVPKADNTMSPRSDTTAMSSISGVDKARYVSKVGVLRTSLPDFHRSLMEAKKAGKDTDVSIESVTAEEHDHTLSSAQQADLARRLKPHSRPVRPDDMKKPAGMTPVPQKKSKPTRWQFGIRSRNQPLEAIGCIYRALQKLGAEWKVDEDWKPRNEESRDRHNDGSFVSDNDDDGGSLHHTESMVNTDGSSNPRFISREQAQHYKLPADPWVLRVRWKKDGMYPPGTVPPGSTHSSMVDLRRHSMASLSSAAGSLPSGTPPPHGSTPKDGIRPHLSKEADDSVIMHLDIQLYEMEPGVYLVDFKCAGYESGAGTMLEEKEVTSPFPFLDLASKLIIQLAEAD